MANYRSRVPRSDDIIEAVTRLQRDVNDLKIRSGRSKMQNVDGTGPPVTGTWKRGDKIWNTAPASGGFIGWVCTADGSPGTWTTFGGIT